MFPPSRIPALRSDLDVEVFDDEIVVFDPESGDLHHLDPNATRVWNAVDGKRTASEVVDRIAATVYGDPDVVDRDVRDLLERFESTGLLT